MGNASISAGAFALYTIMGLYFLVVTLIIALPARPRTTHNAFLGVISISYLVRVISCTVFIAFMRRMPLIIMVVSYFALFLELCISGYAVFKTFGCCAEKRY